MDKIKNILKVVILALIIVILGLVVYSLVYNLFIVPHHVQDVFGPFFGKAIDELNKLL